MGKVLQIRVSAWTYDEDEVVRTWPRLTELVWPQLDKWVSAGMKRGVLELAEYAADAIRFSDMPEARKKRLAPWAEAVTTLLREMREALANWNPRAANALSEKLEDALSDLERQMGDGNARLP